jgi:hypothetical protein
MSTWNPAANELFLRALDLPGPAERSAFLDEACRADPDLRGQVESLLAAGDRAGSFLENPADALAETGHLSPTVRPEAADPTPTPGGWSPAGTGWFGRSAWGEWAPYGWPSRPNPSGGR